MKLVTTNFCIAAVMAWTMALGAQSAQPDQRDQTYPRGGGPQTTTPQPRGDTQTTTPQARDTTTTVSYIGCVEASAPNAFALSISEIPGTTAGTQTPSGADASGAARAGDASASASASGQAEVNQGNQPIGTTGTGAATLVVGQRVQLIGGARANLSTHVGHKVEVSGTMVPQGAAQGRTTGQPAAEMRLNVSNVKMISAMCDAATSTPQTQPRSAAPDSTTQPGGTPGAEGTSGSSPSAPGATQPSDSGPLTPEQQPQRQQ